MRSGLGHRIVCYMVMDILEEHSGSIFTWHLKMEAICSDGKSRHPPIKAHGLITRKTRVSKFSTILCTFFFGGGRGGGVRQGRRLR
jgi:hypothetical protein